MQELQRRQGGRSKGREAVGTGRDVRRESQHTHPGGRDDSQHSMAEESLWRPRASIRGEAGTSQGTTDFEHHVRWAKRSHLNV